MKHRNQEINDLEVAELIFDEDVLAKEEEEIRRLRKELFNESEADTYANKTAWFGKPLKIA